MVLLARRPPLGLGSEVYNFTDEVSLGPKDLGRD